MSRFSPKSILAKLDVRFRKARTGSVLILVIVLLLLLAILGAAFISTTRSDRVASAQNVVNADVDAEASGIGSAVSGIIADDLNDDFGDLRGNASGNVNAAGTQLVPLGQHEIFRGVYAAGIAYQIGDVVGDGGTPPIYYVCMVANPPAGPMTNSVTPWKQTTHLPVTSSITKPWLAERAPSPDDNAVNGGAAWTNVFLGSISEGAVPAIGAAVGTTYAPVSLIGNLPVESPDGTPPGTGIGLVQQGQTLQSLTQKLFPCFRYSAYYKTGMQATNVVVPAMGSNASPNKAASASNTFVAGDADGDGVADSLMFRLPGVTYDGLTWYAAVRVIDNNSAINANTAWSRDYEYGYNAATPGGILALNTQTPPATPNNYYTLFQTSVGLYESLSLKDITPNSPGVPSGFDQFNNRRFGSSVADTILTLTNNLVYPDSSLYVPPPSPGTYPPQAARGDVAYITASDALYQNMIRRINNPGNPGILPTATAPYICQPLPLSEQSALAYRFCLVNPQTIVSGTPSTVLETLLPNSLWLFSGARSEPYAGESYQADDQSNWYNDNFSYGAPGTDALPAGGLRPLLVTHNPVSNAIAPVIDPTTPGEPLQNLGATIPSLMLPYGVGDNPPTGAKNYNYFKGIWNSRATYNFNDIVVGGDGLTYIWVASAAGNSGAAPALSGAGANFPGIASQWQFQPWSQTPTKANINIATFRELFRDFWCVMAGNPSDCAATGPVFQGTTPAQMTLYNNVSQIYNVDAVNLTTVDGNPLGPFRSPIRDNLAVQLTNAYTNPPVPGVSLLDGPQTAGGQTAYKGTNAMQLRAALGAVNAIALRDNSQNVISRKIYLNNVNVDAGDGKAPVSAPVEATVYSNSPQPVISEVYVNLDNNTDGPGGLQNKMGYVAVELFNPYSVDINLAGWQVAYIPRPSSSTANGYATGQYPNHLMVPIAPLVKPNAGTTLVIPAGGFVLLENYNAGDPKQPLSDNALATADTNAAAYRPADLSAGNGGAAADTMPASQMGAWAPLKAGAPAPSPETDVYVPFLTTVISGTPEPSFPQTLVNGVNSVGGEFVLLRPRRADGTLTNSADPVNSYSEYVTLPTDAAPYSLNFDDLVPVDSFDFDSPVLVQPAPNAPNYTVISYFRNKDVNNGFRAFYPGSYGINASTGLRQRDTGYSPTNKGAVPAYTNTSSTNCFPCFGQNTPLITGPLTGPCVVGNFPPVQIFNLAATPVSQHFPKAVVSPAGDTEITAQTPLPYGHPFGTFPRNGDILDVPFVGAYRLRLISTISSRPDYFLEMNSLPMDIFMSSVDYAAATVTVDGTASAVNTFENLGRFVPILASTGGVALPLGFSDEFSWGSRLFDYITVQSEKNTFLPNFDPDITDVTIPPNAGYLSKYPQVQPTPSAVFSADPTASDQTIQDVQGVEGLININTANWKVLSMLPMVPNNPTLNQTLAKAIVTYRLTKGPFLSIFDLNNVPGFQQGASGLAPGIPLTAPKAATGILSPPDPFFPNADPAHPPTSSVSTATPDYQWTMNTLDRISNLITTRSDTFTVYVELQGWQNVPPPNTPWYSTVPPQTVPPQPVVTRHFAFIADRSGITADPNTRSVKMTPVPND